ncbi:MAG: ATP-binding protein [Desmonostoc vinosum HA7617-LM4]|jgi:hypothetical protein|nr:ATP-binding protein [Desmonostoc vinosum HA7617-LM4]
MSQEVVNQIFSLIELHNRLIAVEVPLQERLRLLKNLALNCTQKNINCYLWTLEDDQLHQLQVNEHDLTLRGVPQYQAIAKTRREHYFEILKFWKTTDLQGILILEGIFPWLGTETTDPDFFLTSEWIKSALINLKLYNHNSNKTAILLGTNATVSSDIAPEVPIVTQQLPSLEEITLHLASSLEIEPAQLNTIASAAVGMYLADITYALAIALTQNNGSNFSAQNIALSVFNYKIELIKRTYSIEFMQPGAIALGGLELMQERFVQYRRLLTPVAKSYNLKLPKGILLVGPPGTGKSYSAKACSQILGFPLMVLEWGSFRSYGHEAEHKLKKLLALVDRINRVILYLDDFDKGFAGDDDLSKRLAGMLLTWMQERTSEVLVMASANRMEWLPPEMTRSGRFDDIYKVDLPNNGERHSIFKIHLSRFDKRFVDGDPFTTTEWRRLLKETNRCVGAEIQSLVERAAAAIFYQMSTEDIHDQSSLPPLEFTLSALLEARQTINPLAIREADKIESMRNKASLQGLPSSPVDSSIYSTGDVNIFS